MHKWIFISASLLPMFLIGCTEHSLDSESLSNEEVLINFSTGYTIDYDIDVVPVESALEDASETRATGNECSVGIVGIAATEDDLYSDCLSGLSGDSFCNNLYNAEFTGSLPGNIKPADGVTPAFPIEENSAVAVYAYSPHRENQLVVGDTSCYVRLDLIKEKMSNDYCYTGKVFREKEGFKEDDKINLAFKHAFAKVKFKFNIVTSQRALTLFLIDSLDVGIGENGKGLLDLKNGNFYPDENYGNDGEIYSFSLDEIIKSLNIGDYNTDVAKYIPPIVTLKNIRLVFRNLLDGRKYTKNINIDKQLNLERGKEYSVTFRFDLLKLLK